LSAQGFDETAWQAWWLLARGQWLPDRDASRERVPTTPDAPLARLGEGAGTGRGAADLVREALTTRVAVPLLLELGAAANTQADLRASALLALARLSTGAPAQQLVLAAVRDPTTPQLVRESAALALGLFRRSRADQQLPACALDLLREAALELVDDERAPESARAFAAFALGLLGDQPFMAIGDEPPGQGLALQLWLRLARPRSASDLPVALLTALSQQPRAALPVALRDSLRALVVGRPVLGRRWEDRERSHALSALARLDPAASVADLLRVLGRRREADEVTRAAALAVGAHAGAWSAERRAEAWPVLQRALRDANDPWTRGLLRLALGRVLGADLASGSQTLAKGGAAQVLFDGTTSGALAERGYALLALALASRGALDGGETPEWVARARGLFLKGLSEGGQDDGLRAAHAVALGILGDRSATPGLVAVVGDREVGPQTRGHGAVALAQIDAHAPEALRALVITLSERTHEELRSQAALSLSWLHAREALPLLLRQVTDPQSSEHLLAQAAVALGRLGDLGAVGALAELARDGEHGEIGRALAVVALGLVLDPEPRPSLLRLAADANYPARTASLHELLTIL
jgi:HEAT repeat protein